MSIQALGLANRTKENMETIDQPVCVEKIDDLEYRIWIKPKGCQWVGYKFVRDLIPEGRRDLWRVVNATIFEIDTNRPKDGYNITNEFPVTTSRGGWEYVFRRPDRVDFSGTEHGNELLQTLSASINGKVVALPEGISYANRFEVCQHTTIYDAGATGETNFLSDVILGEMYVRHIWTGESLQVKFEFEWAITGEIHTAFAMMFPVLRDNVATKGRFLDAPTTYSLPHGHSQPGKNSYGVETWNDTNKLGMKLEFNNLDWFQGFSKTNGRGIWFVNQSTHNKIYPTVTSGGLRIDVSAGDVWRADGTYDIKLTQ